MTDNTFTTLADIQEMQESADVECKLAGSRDGKGAMPELNSQSPDLDKQNQLLWQQLQSVASPIIQSQGRKPQ